MLPALREPQTERPDEWKAEEDEQRLEEGLKRVAK
jgi:hypothetical protein